MSDRINEEENFHDAKFSAIIEDNSVASKIEDSIYENLNDSTFNYFRNLISRSVVNKNVLECGCGIDDFSRTLVRDSKHYVAIDLSASSIEYQKTKKSEFYEKVEYYKMNIENLKFENESFDIVFGQSILHHTDLKKSFGEISRVLRPDGQAYFLEPIKYNPIVSVYRMLTPTLRTKTEHPLTISDIQLAKKYFDNVDIKYFNFFSYITMIPYLSKKRNAIIINHLDEIFLRIIPCPIFFATTMICIFSN